MTWLDFCLVWFLAACKAKWKGDAEEANYKVIMIVQRKNNMA